MAQIAMKIPTGSNSWIQGECQLQGYETYLMVDKVSYGVAVAAEIASDGRRTVHTPQVSEVTVERHVDIATGDLTRYILSLYISQPWEIYFFKDLGGGPVSDDSTVRHLCHMSMMLYQPLITSQSVTLDEGSLVETLKVSAAAIEWGYTAYDDSQQILGNTGFTFDVQAGTIS